MAVSHALRRLARLHGILTEYTDVLGKTVSAAPDTLEALIGALRGSPPSEGVERALDERVRRLATETLDPIAVAWNGGPVSVSLRMPARMATGRVVGMLELESGEERPLDVDLVTLPKVRAYEVGGVPYVRLRLTLPGGLPIGYHELRLELGGEPVVCRVFSAPEHAYRPAHGSGDGAFGAWGVFVPLYALHSERSHGTGCFGDLAALGDWAAGYGAGLVGTLPLLPAFLDEPYEISPYAPVSRLFWNELHVDLERIPELATNRAAQRILEGKRIRHAFDRLRSGDRTDPRTQMTLMRTVLKRLSKGFFSGDSPRRAEFEAFRASRPMLDDYAAFRAAGEREKCGWSAWSHEARFGALTPDGYDEDAFRLHQYVQWIADEQLAACADRLSAHGPGLYLDLPIGVHADSFDTWREGDLFAMNTAVGAPPDPLAPSGQDWGLPPIRPDVSRHHGHEHVIAFIRHHCRRAGALRIDHALGLHRQYWIPSGMPGESGGYVRMPFDELYAILCIESVRHDTILIGEDLGTVAGGVRERLARHHILRMHVVQGELERDAVSAFEDRPPKSVTSLNTHDMSPFARFLEGGDITTWVEVGLLPAEKEPEARARRVQALGDLERVLRLRGHVGGEPTPEDLLVGTLREIARRPAEITMVSLEDLWLETRAQNVPGTTDAHPNWRHVAALSLEEIAQHPGAARCMAAIRDARAGGIRAEHAGAGRARAERASVTVRSRAEVAMTPDDVYLFNEGRHFRLFEKLGAHVVTDGDEKGVHFAVWAPAARSVHVIGSFNGWSPTAHPLKPVGASGVWAGFVREAAEGAVYKYRIISRVGGHEGTKADPFASRAEIPPRTASVVHEVAYEWGDAEWMASRAERQSPDAPIAIYEMHLGSWRRHAEGRPFTYRELADALPRYLSRLGFTHVELMPITEHPFDGSWGYQTTGYFAPTSRFGSPEDFMFLVDELHRHGIGVILDWVPSHFPTDGHGLGYFDGTHLFEHADPRQGFHPDWKTHIFNYGRPEVRAFLISSATLWLERYHVDGIRVDAVASMLYLDYSRNEGEWVANRHGGRENLEAIEFLKQLNDAIGSSHPGALRIAEESTSWPRISAPVHEGGLGFDYKWDMGWMNDTLEYVALDPLFRGGNHDKLTFRGIYAGSERFLLALSHDEVVHGKRSLLSKMPGDWWKQFATLRALYGYMYGQTGKKLLFMGAEFGQWQEWNHESELDWVVSDMPAHAGLSRWLRDLNAIYRTVPALHTSDCSPGTGFEWIDCHDRDRSAYSFLRRDAGGDGIVLVVSNFTPVVRRDFSLGVPRAGRWRQLLNSDAERYGGSGVGVLDGVESTETPVHGHPNALRFDLPPLATVYFEASPAG